MGEDMTADGFCSEKRRPVGGVAGSAGPWLRPAVALLVFVFAAACQNADILSTQQGGALVHKTKLGMSVDDVVRDLGQPHKRETYEATEFLFYNTNWTLADAAAQRSPIAVVHGKVVGLGKSYYDTFIKARTTWTSDVSVAQPAWAATVNP